MKECREKVLDNTLEEEVLVENKAASLSVKNWAKLAGLIEDAELVEDETSEDKHAQSKSHRCQCQCKCGKGCCQSNRQTEVEKILADLPQEVDSFLEPDYDSFTPAEIAGGLYAIAASIFFLAIMYFGVHLLDNPTSEEVIVPEEPHYHYETEFAPYEEGDFDYSSFPHDTIEEYFFREIMGF